MDLRAGAIILSQCSQFLIHSHGTTPSEIGKTHKERERERERSAKKALLRSRRAQPEDPQMVPNPDRSRWHQANHSHRGHHGYRRSRSDRFTWPSAIGSKYDDEHIDAQISAPPKPVQTLSLKQEKGWMPHACKLNVLGHSPQVNTSASFASRSSSTSAFTSKTCWEALEDVASSKCAQGSEPASPSPSISSSFSLLSATATSPSISFSPCTSATNDDGIPQVEQGHLTHSMRRDPTPTTTAPDNMVAPVQVTAWAGIAKALRSSIGERQVRSDKTDDNCCTPADVSNDPAQPDTAASPSHVDKSDCDHVGCNNANTSGSIDRVPSAAPSQTYQRDEYVFATPPVEDTNDEEEKQRRRLALAKEQQEMILKQVMKSRQLCQPPAKSNSRPCRARQRNNQKVGDQKYQILQSHNPCQTSRQKNEGGRAKQNSATSSMALTFASKPSQKHTLVAPSTQPPPTPPSPGHNERQQGRASPKHRGKKQATHIRKQDGQQAKCGQSNQSVNNVRVSRRRSKQRSEDQHKPVQSSTLLKANSEDAPRRHRKPRKPQSKVPGAACNSDEPNDKAGSKASKPRAPARKLTKPKRPYKPAGKGKGGHRNSE